MAMNAAALAASLKAEIDARLKAKYDPDSIPDNHQLAGFTWDDWYNDLTEALAVAIVNHIQGNAQAAGISHGEAHDLPIV